METTRRMTFASMMYPWENRPSSVLGLSSMDRTLSYFRQSLRRIAAYNLARVAFGNLEEQEGMHEESHDGPSSSPDLIEDMAEIMVKTCDKCGSTFRTPGLLRSVRRNSFHEEAHIF
jgi:hypothetical protein